MKQARTLLHTVERYHDSMSPEAAMAALTHLKLTRTYTNHSGKLARRYDRAIYNLERRSILAHD